MRIRHLSLTNFRNFGRMELEFPEGITLLYGQNAQGKTNLLESIYYLATTKSPHTNQDQQLINWDAGQFGETIVVGRLVAHLQTERGTRHLEMRLIREHGPRGISFRREALVDRRKVRLMDLLGNLRVVLFLPQDMNLVTGPPSGRRRYLDITLCQSDRDYCRTLSRYNKVLEQRNALLRRLAESGQRQGSEVLTVFSEQLIPPASKIFKRRATFLDGLAREVQRVHYESLTAGQETIRLHYLPQLLPRQNGQEPRDAERIEAGAWLGSAELDLPTIEQRYREALEQSLTRDLARGATTVGPHRDDWRFDINGRSLSDYGSRGQQRSAVLALKMGEIAWVSAETNDTPLLLLDDVMAELDMRRRELLINTLQDVNQTFLTTADVSIFNGDFLTRSNALSVVNGRVQPQPPDM